jgi:hypothetical protein
MNNKATIEFKFDLFGDYKKQFAAYVTELNDVALELALEERIARIDALTNAYVDAIGEKPEPEQLEKLGTLILLEYYTSTKKNKKDEENPVLSTKQVLRRKLNERRMHDNM